MRNILGKYTAVLLLFFWLGGCAGPHPKPEQASTPKSSPAVIEQPTPVELEKPGPAQPKPPVVRQRPALPPAAKNFISQARAAKAAGNYQRALLLLDRAQRVAPKSAEVYLEMARVQKVAGNLTQAEQLCLKAVSLSASDKQFRRVANRELAYIRNAM